MKILIVSGFLGVGKTTFIKEMAAKTGRDFVIMENEYGEAGIDSALLNQEKNINVWELTEGCVCCTMKADFASSVLTIANTLDPEYLIVEPTGVGMLSNIIQNIRQISYERILLLKPVTIVDADSFDFSRRMYGEILTDQIRAAGTVVISKRSFSSVSEASGLLDYIRKINPGACIQYEHYSRQDSSWWESLLKTRLDGTRIDSPALAEPELDTLSLQNPSLPSANHIIFFLEDLIRGEFGCICRAKGLIQTEKGLLRFDAVNDRYSITGCEQKESPGATFIGRDLKRNRLRRLLLSSIYTSSKISGRKTIQNSSRKLPGFVTAPKNIRKAEEAL